MTRGVMSRHWRHEQYTHEGRAAQTQPNEAAQNLFPDILRELPVGVVLLHLEDPSDFRSFKIVGLNAAAAEITGSTIETLQGRTLADFPQLLETHFPRFCLRVSRTGEPEDLGAVSYEDELIRSGIYSVRLFPVSDDYLGIAVADVTKRLRAEQALRESEARFRLLVEGDQEYAIFQLDPTGHVISWNAGAERLKGYSTDEIIGKHLSVFYTPEDTQHSKPKQMLEKAVHEGRSEDEGWRVRKDGSRFWAHVIITALRGPDGNLQGFAKLTRDMSERREKLETLKKANEELELRVERRAAVLIKINEELRVEIAERARAEGELRTSLHLLRALAARLQHVREEERLFVAQEIHDELGQVCTALKMDLALIGSKATKKQTQLQAKVTTASQLVDDMTVTLRRIASELRPRALDDLGLQAALELQAQEFESRTGIPCHLTLPEEPFALDPDKSIAIFRIFQESLTNVARHANATHVEASLTWESEHLVFQVQDNGKGFNLEETAARKSLGLLGMQERALVLNGELKLQGVPGAG